MSIALVGGQAFCFECLPMDLDLLRRIPASRPRVLVLPIATRTDPRDVARQGERYFTALGAATATALIRSRADAANERHIASLASADVLYLTGDDPRQVFETLRDTRLWVAIVARHVEGALVAAADAAALVLAAWWRAQRGGWSPALGLAEHVAVLPADSLREHPDYATVRAGLPDDVQVLCIPPGVACFTEDGAVWQAVGRADVPMLTAEGKRTAAAWEAFTV